MAWQERQTKSVTRISDLDVGRCALSGKAWLPRSLKPDRARFPSELSEL